MARNNVGGEQRTIPTKYCPNNDSNVTTEDYYLPDDTQPVKKKPVEPGCSIKCPLGSFSKSDEDPIR